MNEAIKRGMYWAIGPEIEKFETLIADYIGTKYCAVFNSGTSALHAALLAHDIKIGDEVIVPSFTFIATHFSSVVPGFTISQLPPSDLHLYSVHGLNGSLHFSQSAPPTGACQGRQLNSIGF